ncbi:hypothetical protein RB195_013318 [Necator americanus]|uniref:Secreted protein n=1 Tax=Necator americanus TaxID=51031 RepID=A0ABR1DV22_NECAM
MTSNVLVVHVSIVAVVASTSDWNAPPRRRSISTVCGPSNREINQFYAHFFPEKEVPQQYGVYNTGYLNHTPHQNVYFGVSDLFICMFALVCVQSSICKILQILQP